MHLAAAVTLMLLHALVEAQRRRTERGEAILQLRLLQLVIDLRMLARKNTLLARTRSGQQWMAGDLVQIGTVDDQFRFA